MGLDGLGAAAQKQGLRYPSCVFDHDALVGSRLRLFLDERQRRYERRVFPRALKRRARAANPNQLSRENTHSLHLLYRD